MLSFIFFLIIAYLFINMLSKQTKQQSGSSSYAGNNREAFINALLYLIAAMMKADGTVKRTELDFVKRQLVDILGIQRAQTAVLQLRDILKENADLSPKTIMVRFSVNYDTKLMIIHILYGIAIADGEVTTPEIQLIYKIAGDIGVLKQDVDSVLNAYRYTHSSYSNSNGQSRSNSAYKGGLDEAYKVLEITPQATDDEVKKAFRNLAKKFHPDKVAGLGKEVEDQAQERFKKINDAYEKIKQARGMK